MSIEVKNPTTPEQITQNTASNTAESTSANTCDKCKVIAIELTKDANNIVTERQLSLDNIPPLPAQVITINITQDSLNKPITLENGAVIQVNDDGSVIFHDKGAYDSLQVGESAITQVQVNIIDFDENLIALNLELEQIPPAVDVIQDEGSITLVEVRYPGLEGNVDSLPRDLGINYSFEPFTSYTPTLVQSVKFDSQPVAPLIVLDPVFESNLGSSSSSASTFTSLIVLESDNCQSCIANSPNIVTTNIFAEGASFGLDGAGSFGLLPFIRQGVTIDDITAHQATIGFTDPGGVMTALYPAPFQSQSTFYQDPNGAYQTVTTPEGNTLTLYLTNYMGHSMGDLVYELNHNVPHIPGLPGLNVIDTALELQGCGCSSASCTVDAQVFFDPFMYYIQDVDGDIATNFIYARVVDDVPIAVNDIVDIIKPPLPEYNLTFVIDNSNSMNALVNGTDSRLDIVKSTLAGPGGILDAYNMASATITISIITFSNQAFESPEFTNIQDAKDYINSIVTPGAGNNGTVLDESIALAITDIYADGLNVSLNDAIDRLYLLSDGAPSPGAVPTDQEVTDWQNALLAENVDAIMINIGGSNAAVTANLAPLANPTDDPAVLEPNTSLTDLQELLQNSLTISATGNLLANDKLSADPTIVTQISFDLGSEQAAQAYLNAHPGLIDASISGSSVFIPVSNGEFSTPLGNLLSVDTFGNYTYTYTNNPYYQSETFNYTIEDSDFDTSSAPFTINLAPGGPTAFNDAQDIVKPPLPEYNLTFVIDNSNSMSVDLGQGLTRLQVLQQTLAGAGGILDAYANASSKLTISVVNFSDTAGISNEFNNIQDAKDYINNLAIPGPGHLGTVLGSGIEVALADIIADGNNAALANAHDVLYLLTDGGPAPAESEQGTPQGIDHAIVDSGELADWQAALLAQNVDAVMVNIGGGAAEISQNIAPLANPTDNPAVLEPNASLTDLQELLQNSLSMTVSGNLLTNDIASVDVPTLVTQVSFNLASAQDALDYLSAHPELIGASSSGSSVIIPIADGEFTTPFGNTLSVDANGNYTYTYINNPYFQTEVFTYTIADSNGDDSSATLTINLSPGGPTAFADVQNIQKPELPEYNLTFVIDNSNSMSVSLEPGVTRLERVQETLAGAGGILDAYAGASSKLTISIINFSDTAEISNEFNNIQDAKNYINNLAIPGNGHVGTVLGSGIEVALADILADGNNAALANAIDRLYLLTDGAPATAEWEQGTPQGIDHAIVDSGELADWQAALLAQNVDAVMVNIGGGAAEISQNIAPLANPSDDPAVLEADSTLSNLQALLQSSLTPISVTGNVLTNDVLSIDAPTIVTQISFALGSTQDALDYLAAHPELTGASSFGSSVIIPIGDGEFTTALGNTLIVDENGNYTYKYINNNNVESESFTYTIQDNNGDASSANLNINLTPPNTVIGPVILDLNGNGLELTSAADSNVSWNNQKTGWVGPNDGILAYDENGDGKVDGLNEIMLSKYNPNAVTDLDGLKLAFDSNHDSIFNDKDAHFNDFLLWKDTNQDGISQSTEVSSLNAAGIVSIDLTQLGHSEMINGNIVYSTLSYENASGDVLLAGDVGLRTASVSSSISSNEVIEPPNQLENVLNNSSTQTSNNSANPSIEYNSSFNATEHQETLQIQQAQQQQHETGIM